VKFLDPLYTAVAWVMAEIHAGLSQILPSTSGEAWFLTIILLVVFMRLLLVPLFVKQMHSMRKMSALAPQLQELRKKYKGDKQTLNEETIFGAHISDKVLFTGTMYVPLHAKIVILCFVTISVVTTFMTVRQSTKRGMTPQMTPDNPMAASQKYMAYIVPFFALSGLYWAFGLVLYWVTTNVWTLGQQWVLFKRYPAPVPGAAPAGGGTTAPAVVRPAPAKPTTASRLTSAKSVAPKPAAATKPTDSAKPPGAAKPAASTGSAAAKPSAAKPSAPAAAKGGAAAATGQASRKKTQAGSVPGGGSRSASTAGQPTSANGSGLLRRLGRKAPEPEPQPETPDVKLVRQQRVRQSRSKRSGKR